MRNYSNEQLIAQLYKLVDSDPAKAVRQARQIDIDSSDRQTVLPVRAAILIDGGAAAKQLDAIEEGLLLYRELYNQCPDATNAYNLANALVAISQIVSHDSNWLEHKEKTSSNRFEARKLYWQVVCNDSADYELTTQAWTNLANQLSYSFRFGEAHDARLAAIRVDPTNGVAAGAAARELLWLSDQCDCSDIVLHEAVILARLAKKNESWILEHAGQRVASILTDHLDESIEVPPKPNHNDPFIQWVERERLTLAPVTELVQSSLEKIDWIMLPGIFSSHTNCTSSSPPPVFAMFNVLKADFILARDLIWKVVREIEWPAHGKFADTLDYAVYGPQVSALVLAHRAAVDLLDKIAVVANTHFNLGLAAKKVDFHSVWRERVRNSTGDRGRLRDSVSATISRGVTALYGLVELADDYIYGFLRSHKDLRNAGTHRFIVLHDIGFPSNAKSCPEIEHHRHHDFLNDAINALRIGRSAMQILVTSIRQYEALLMRDAGGRILTIDVPDHDKIRGK